MIAIETRLGQDVGSAAVGLDADEVFFALAAATEGRPLQARHQAALTYAHNLLQALASLEDEGSTQSRSFNELRGLLATRNHAIHAAPGDPRDLSKFREAVLQLDEQIQELLQLSEPPSDPHRYDTLLRFFEILSASLLAAAYRATEEADPAWMSLLPNGPR